MFLLTREVRFAADPANILGPHLRLAVCLSGNPAPDNQYVVDIKQVDLAVRQRAVDLFANHPNSVGPLMSKLMERLSTGWPPGVRLQSVLLSVTPLLNFSAIASESPMIRVSQKFEFSAAHRLHNPKLTDEQNRTLFGKCNNPHGHGHNYELQVTLLSAAQNPIDHPALERTVSQTVLDRFDHKNLNVEVAEFTDLIPTVENIAMTIYRLLKPKFIGESKLASVTVWETPKTWCEYTE